MQIINQQPQPFVTIVGCVHGNEYLGCRAFEYFALHRADYPSVQFILANEPAIAADCRYLEQDLNRSFPGKLDGKIEERLASELLTHVRTSRYVLDLHTTSSDIRMTPIVTNLGADTCRVVNLCDSHEVALIEPELASKSLIGQCQAGVSLEYHEKYTPALADVFRIVDALLDKHQVTPSVRRIFHIVGPVTPTVAFPSDTKNFVYSPALQGYPFLVGERSYPNGLLASRCSSQGL